MPIASITAKILLISFMPTASSIVVSSESRALVGGRADPAGDHDGELPASAVAGERRDGGLLAIDSALVVTRDDDLALVLGREDVPLRHPLIGRRRRQPRSLRYRRERPLAGLADRIGPTSGNRDRGLHRGNRRD